VPRLLTLLRPVTRPALGLLRRAGYNVVRMPTGMTDGTDIRIHWIRKLGIDLVVDVGANEGQFVGWMRDRGYAGRIVSFEPQRGAFEACTKRWGDDPRWSGHHTALGERAGELAMQVAGNSVSSSLLPMLGSHVGALPESAIVGTESVTIRRLDEVLAGDAGNRLFLKVDTQGYELPVLKGATGLMGRVAFIELELSLVPLYEGQVLLPEMMQAVAAMGFTPIALEPGFADEREGRLLQMDGLFVRTDLLGASGASSASI
jgi:FkbM family methyltransferase